MPDAPADPPYDLDVSVIIPALEATPHALRIVRLLAEQSHDFSFEVLLVLNHEERPVEADLPARARVLFCPERGAFAARNAGIAAARGRVLAFTDSDVIPRKDWLREGYVHAELTNFSMILGGDIRVYVERQTAVSLYESSFYFRQGSYVLHGRFVSPANMWVARDVIERIGPFDRALSAAAEQEFSWRAEMSGVQIVHAQTVVVYHPARWLLRDLLTKEIRTAGAQELLASAGFSGTHKTLSLKGEIRLLFHRMAFLLKRAPMRRKAGAGMVALVIAGARICERLRVRCGKHAVPH